MKYQCLFIVTTFHAIMAVRDEDQEPWHRVKLHAVTKSEGIEQFYLNIRERRQDPTQALMEQKENHPNIKVSLCKNIFTTDYFDINKETWLNTDLKRARSELKEKEPLIFEDLYTTKSKLKKKFFFLPNRSPSFDYVNAYKLRPVSVDGQVIKESVIICAVKQLLSSSSTSNIKTYFISEEYNVNADSSGPYIVGRFIFQYNNEDELMVIALAEETARVFVKEPKAVEMFYLDRRIHSIRPASENAEDDLICKLSRDERLRLCTIVFSSPGIRNKIKFLPTLESVQGDCEKRKISFTTVETKDIAANMVYEEWMIPCVCSSARRQDDSKIIYYISRAHASNRVFVYERIDETIHAKYYNYNVSVISDRVNY